jgi:hypothetical protein
VARQFVRHVVSYPVERIRAIILSALSW